MYIAWPLCTSLRLRLLPHCVSGRGSAAEPVGAQPSPPVCWRTRDPASPPHAGDGFNDLHRFSPAASTWTRLPPSGSVPSPRFWFGFAATPDGMLYVFGGNFGGTAGVGLAGGGVAWNEGIASG
jgi:hypothetical protein